MDNNNDENNRTSKLRSNKKLEKKYYQQKAEIKQELSTSKKFIEYFFIIGLDPKISIENFLYNSSIDDLHNLFSKELKPRIITKFPPINKSHINIDDNLSELCFPEGFKIEKHEEQPKPEIQKFLLGNYFYSIDFPLKYITCLKIYESLSNYQSLQLKIKRILGGSSINIRKSSKNIFFTDSIDEEINFRKNSTISSKDMKSCLEDNDKINKNEFHKYFFPKIIGFVSLKPFYKYHEKILFQIYDFYKNPIKFKMPLEKTILNILYNIPMPSRGLNTYQYKINEIYEKIDIRDEKMNKLKNIDDDLKIVFKYFDTDNFIEIFKYILYETKTIIFGTNGSHLCSFVYGLISILYPFTYPFQVSSSVHKSAFEVLESISPYIIGVNHKLTDDFFTENKIEIKGSNYIIIDLDNKEFSLNIVEEVPNIPKNLYKRLKTKIDTNIKKHIKSKLESNLKNKEEEEKDENLICFAFFDFFLNALYNYMDYLNNDNFKKNYKISSLKVLFNIKEFIDSHSSNERSFYKKLVETQMFNDFIFKKMIPKDINDKLEILFFDEHINKINNKKLFSKNKSVSFINSKEYEYKDAYKIPILNGLSQREKHRYYDKNYILNSLLLGQEIVQEKLNNKNTYKIEENSKDNNNIINEEEDIEFEDEGDYYFNYVLFPKFNKDFFNDPSLEYSLYTPAFSDINRINTDLLAKSHISSTSGEIIETDEGMLDYIYLTYIEVWGYSYWYQDIIEKDYRFNQMMEILDKIKHQEIEIINVLFESLNKFQEKEKIMKLYNKILAYKITPNSFIYSIVGKIVQKKIENPQHLFGIKSLDTSNFPKRTFRSENETNILGDKISFNCLQNCPDCNKLINVENLSRDYKKMKKDLCWAKCPYCNYIKPEVSLNFGCSISSKDSIISCSKEEKFTLCSPYELKNSIKDIVEKEKFHLLDIDKFKMKFPNLFWSCIWYFHLYNLDYNIILPYEVNIFKQHKGNSTRFTNLNSKILPLLKNNNIISLSEKISHKIIMNNLEDKLFVVQNIFSFSYRNNIYYDYFGTFRDNSGMKNINSYFNNRQKSYIKIKSKNTISGFLFSGGDKKLSDKNINKLYDLPSSPNIKQKKQSNKFITDAKLEKRFSEPVYSEENVNDDINELKPFFILEKDNSNNKKKSSNNNGNNSSFSLEEHNN